MQGNTVVAICFQYTSLSLEHSILSIFFSWYYECDNNTDHHSTPAFKCCCVASSAFCFVVVLVLGFMLS